MRKPHRPSIVLAIAAIALVAGCGLAANDEAVDGGGSTTSTTLAGFPGAPESSPGEAQGDGSTTPATLPPPVTVTVPVDPSTTTTTKPPRIADDPEVQPACDALVYLRDTLENIYALGDLDAYHAAAANVLGAIDTVRRIVPADVLDESGSTDDNALLLSTMRAIQQAASFDEVTSVLDDLRAAGDRSLEGGPDFAPWFQGNCPTV